MTLTKRALDFIVLLAIAPFVVPIGVAVALLILIVDGRPIFFAQERMKGVDQPFTFWKFRTMTVDTADAGVAGGDKTARITRLGRILRRGHLDEIPQAWNVLIGDVTLVGPRAPLRLYVERFPELYQKVLKSRPGLTGFASFFYSRHEQRILSRCKTAEETDAAYSRRCVPWKARLDLIYQRHQSVCLDAWIFWLTTKRILHLPGQRQRRKRS